MIDANMYYVPEALFTDEALGQKFIDEIPAENGWYGYFQQVEGTGLKQIVLEKPKGSQNLNYLQGDYVLETMLADLDKAGVEQAVLKVPGCHEWMSLDFCKLFNDGMANYAKRSNGRLIPLAVLPPYGTEEDLAELKRCVEELHMIGVQCAAHYGDEYLDSMKFDRFFRKVNEYGLTVYVHHTPIPVEYNSFIAYNNVRRSYGRIVDQGLAVSRELFGGFFDRYPNIKMVHSMLGGGFFAIANMMFPHKSKTKETVARFATDNSDVEAQFHNNVYFEMSHAAPWGKKQLECAVQIYGADHVIFGSSYPVRKEWLFEGPAVVDGLNITAEEKQQIMTGNAQMLYGSSKL